MVMRLNTLLDRLADAGAITIVSDDRLVNATEEITGAVPSMLLVDETDDTDDDEDEEWTEDGEDDEGYDEDDEDEFDEDDDEY